MASLHYHTLPLHNHHGHHRLTSPTHPTISHRPPSLPRRYSAVSTVTCTVNSNNSTPKQPPKTLFPGGYKRPEIRVPNVVLEVECGEVVGDKERVVKVVDEAVREVVGVVVLKSGSGGSGSGRVMYDAACLLKAVIRDRAYFLVDERVDVATAVNASGVVLSDQGLPAIVARNTIMDSKSDSVFLPLVGRKVQSSNSDMSDSSFEGADFLIYDTNKEESIEKLSASVINKIKIPTFVTIDSVDEDKLLKEMSYLLQSGASGLVVSMEGLKLLGKDALNMIYSMRASERRMETLNDGLELDKSNGFTGFVNLLDREVELIENERSLLLEAIDVIQRASPLVIF